MITGTTAATIERTDNRTRKQKDRRRYWPWRRIYQLTNEQNIIQSCFNRKYGRK
jgi:hypothetical protein